MRQIGFFKGNIFLLLGLFAFLILDQTPIISSTAHGQGLGEDPLDLDIQPTDVIHWQGVGAESFSEGANIEVGLRLTTERGFSLYVNKVKFKGPPGTEVVNIVGPPSKKIKDPDNDQIVDVYAAGDFLITLTSLEPFKGSTLEFQVTYLGCTERICLFPYTETFELPVTIRAEQASDSKQMVSTEQPIDPPAQSHTSSPKGPGTNQSFEHDFAEKIHGGELSFGVLLLVLFLGGLATNLTPCVFPMLPITIRILGQQSNSRWASAACYALGILLTYTGLGIVAGLSGGVFGSFAGGTGFNIFFGLIFAGLALSMLGFGDFAFLQKLGSRFGSGQRGPLNTLLMGAGAGFVAAPCTGPILGALLAYTANKTDLAQSTALFFTYSLGFSLPYLFLGGFAGSVSKVKVSPKVQVGVKLFFAAVMFALSLYYLRIPARSMFKIIDGNWLYLLCGFGVLGLVSCFIYLGKSMNSSNSSRSKAVLPSLLLGLGVFSGIQYVSGGDLRSSIEIYWHKSLDEGIKAATQEHKPIILDGWADWCAACKEMDVTTYQDLAVRTELSEYWTTVKIDFTELTDELEEFAERYQMQGLPVTILLPPDGDLSKKRRMTGYIPKEKMIEELQKYRKN